MKIIYLDIDGVLNWAGTEDRINGFVGLDSELIARFNQIIDGCPDVKIVISSTWRKSGLFGAYEGFEGLIGLLRSRGLRGDIIGYTPIQFGSRTRGDEIREFIENFVSDFPEDVIEEFVILDDSREGMEGYEIGGNYDFPVETYVDLRPNHVVTEYLPWSGFHGGGLQDHHVKTALAVLGGMKVRVT